ncbi:MAG: hypothetical protein E2P02_10555 [Acidobacteria bacterium]|nr:MAG: hypothetical protein E2P02_10555 [Acidobacteriota bacterium]
MRRETVELLEVLADRARRPTFPLAGVPFHVHATYSRDEISAGLGQVRKGKLLRTQGGVYCDEGLRSDSSFFCWFLVVARLGSLSSSNPRSWRFMERSISSEKPSASAWAVNQLYWKEPLSFEALIAAGDRYRDAFSEQGVREDAERKRLEAVQDATRIARAVGTERRER